MKSYNLQRQWRSPLQIPLTTDRREQTEASQCLITSAGPSLTRCMSTHRGHAELFPKLTFLKIILANLRLCCVYFELTKNNLELLLSCISDNREIYFSWCIVLHNLTAGLFLWFNPSYVNIINNIMWRVHVTLKWLCCNIICGANNSKDSYWPIILVL